MHPELCKRLVLNQLGEACRLGGLFSDAVEIEQLGYPRFFVRFKNRGGVVRLIRFDAYDFDFQPIAIEPVDPVTRESLRRDQWMRRNGGDFPAHHMKGGEPFLCIQGTRDYYTHESHTPSVTGERWERWRGQFSIGDLIVVLKHKFESGEWE